MTTCLPVDTRDESAEAFFLSPFRLGAKLIRGRFAIPSGIRCVRASVIDKCFSSVAPLGVITTKSISIGPRQGYREPIYARYSSGSYINAVGLTNPGAEVACRELQEIAVLKKYKAECRSSGVKVTNTMIAAAADPDWHDRTPVEKWAAAKDRRYNTKRLEFVPLSRLRNYNQIIHLGPP